MTGTGYPPFKKNIAYLIKDSFDSNEVLKELKSRRRHTFMISYKDNVDQMCEQIDNLIMSLLKEPSGCRFKGQIHPGACPHPNMLKKGFYECQFDTYNVRDILFISDTSFNNMELNTEDDIIPTLLNGECKYSEKAHITVGVKLHNTISRNSISTNNYHITHLAAADLDPDSGGICN